MQLPNIHSTSDHSIDALNAQLVLPTQTDKSSTNFSTPAALTDSASAKMKNRGAMRMMKHAAISQPNIQQARCAAAVDNRTLLHQAISENNTEAVRFLVAHGVDINALDADGNTPLIAALEKNMPHIAEILINAKANLDQRRKKDSFSPLEIAISLDSPVATLLLNAGANPNSGRPDAPGLLVQALEKRRIDLASLLIQKGAEVNVGHSKATNPLYQAYILNDPSRTQMVRELLQKSADPNRKLDNQATVFCSIIEHTAANQRNVSYTNLIREFCEKGADVHARNACGQDSISLANNRSDILGILNDYRKDVPFLNQQLNEAVRLKQRDVVQKWCSKGAYINNLDQNGQTNLHRIYMQGDTDFAQFLVEHGADISKSRLPPLAEVIEKQMFQGGTLLNVAEFCLRNRAVTPNDLDQFGRPLISIAVMVGNLDLVQLMIRHKANVEPAQKINGMSPLMLALKFNNEQIAKFLIENNANVNAVHDGKSVIIHVMEKNMNALIPLLLNREVKLNVGDKWENNPLSYAVHSGDFSRMKELKEKGADVNYQLGNRMTALFIAVDNHRSNCVEYLLQNGARHDLKDHHHHSPMWLAIQQGFQDIVALLLKYGANHEDIN